MTAPAHTPRKNAMQLPTLALEAAITAEWQGRKAFSPRDMPLTAMAYAALDIVAAHRESMESAMLAYAETDLLCYRSETPELHKRQQQHWDPVVEWARGHFGDIRVTDGVMPVEQSPQTLAAFHAAVKKMDDFALAAFSVLTQSLGSLLLALAVYEKHLSATQAFRASRVDEDFQAEKWGEDSVNVARASEIERDVQAAERFLRLLDI